MDKPAPPVAVALVALAAVGALGLLVTVPAWRMAGMQDGLVHEVLIGLAVVATTTLAVLALRTFYHSGAASSLALAAGLAGFAAIYVWHGVYTGDPPAFAFLIYGPASRVVLGLALPFLALQSVVARERRFAAAAGVVAGALVLSALTGATHDSIATWAAAADAGSLQAVRRAIEAAAAVLSILAVAIFLLKGHHTPDGANRGMAVAVTLLAAQSIYFLAATPWDAVWWSAHAIGAASSILLTVAVVTRLGHAERAAEVAYLRHVNAIRTRFINAAAHELGTPLTPIQLQLSLLRSRDDPLTDRQARSLDTIQRNVDRLADLTRSIMEGARSQAGHFPTLFEPADIRETLEDIERSYRPWCEEKGLTLSVDAPASLPVFSDRRRIHQIVSNFVSNAIKNTPPGGAIHLGASIKKGRLRVEVADSGRGMTDAERRRLFQPFTQLDDPSKVIGSGLGLYIARQLAERMGGFVGVRSKGLGRGATFFVDLAARMEPDAGKTTPATPPPAQPAPPATPLAVAAKR